MQNALISFYENRIAVQETLSLFKVTHFFLHIIRFCTKRDNGTAMRHFRARSLGGPHTMGERERESGRETLYTRGVAGA